MNTTLRTRNENQIAMDYTERRTALRGYPVFLFVELTQNCNAGCRMCRGTIEPFDSRRNMSPELFERIVNELFPHVSVVDLHGWGESTILPDFSKYLLAATGSGVQVRLITNAIAMTEALWEILFAGDNIVGVSLDTANAEVFARLGRGDFHKVVRNLRTAKNVQRRTRTGRLYLNVVLNAYTLPGLPDLIALAADLGIDRIVVNPIKCPECQRAHLSHVRAQIPTVLDRAAEMAMTAGITLQLGSALDSTFVVQEALPEICSKPWTHALIEYSGHVGFCDHAIRHRAFVFGQLVRQTFMDIWNGPDFRRLRMFHIRAGDVRRLPDHLWKCRWCYSNRYQDAEAFRIGNPRPAEVSTSSSLPLYRNAIREQERVK